MPASSTAPAQTKSPKEYFRTLTPGKLMGLKQITDANGKFKVFALDQSNSFKKALRAFHERTAGKPQDPTFEEVRDTKMEITAALSPYASAVLLDVNYGLFQSVAVGALARGVGLIGRVEASKDAGIPGIYEPGWSVKQIKRMGCSAVKLLVYMDVEDDKYTQGQLKFAKEVYDACAEEDILLMTEELSFPRQGEDKKTPAYVARRPKNILESAKLLGPITDILKLEFPGEEHLKAVNDAAIRPWVLLSAGEKFDVFAKQVEVTMKAGCSGTMAGRAIFNEYFDQNNAAERQNFLKTTGLQRMKVLSDLVDKHAQSVWARYGLTNQDLGSAVDAHWYSGGKALSGANADTRGAY
jgi:tagatose 1,6-diphosphate aldolase